KKAGLRRPEKWVSKREIYAVRAWQSIHITARIFVKQNTIPGTAACFQICRASTKLAKRATATAATPQTDGAGDLAVHGSINGRSGEHDSKGVECEVKHFTFPFSV